MDVRPDGIMHGTRASLTTCENPTADTISKQSPRRHARRQGGRAQRDGLPRSAGDLLLPLMVIPLRHEQIPGVRRTSLIPLVGYSDARAFTGRRASVSAPATSTMGTTASSSTPRSATGPGYVGSFRRKDGKRPSRQLFRLHNKTDGSDQWNADFHNKENPPARAARRRELHLPGRLRPAGFVAAERIGGARLDQSDAQGHPELQLLETESTGGRETRPTTTGSAVRTRLAEAEQRVPTPRTRTTTLRTPAAHPAATP